MTMVNGVDFQQTGNPQADLVTYAKARGIDQATAKKELQAQFGDPQVQQGEKDEDSQLSINTNTSNNATSTSLKDLLKTLLSAIFGKNVSDYGISKSDDEYEDKKATSTTTSNTNTSNTTSTKTNDSTSTKTTSSTSTTSSSYSTSTSTSWGGDEQRNNIQSGIQDWSAKLYQAHAAGDKHGEKAAQAALKGLHAQAYNMDTAKASGLSPR